MSKAKKRNPQRVLIRIPASALLQIMNGNAELCEVIPDGHAGYSDRCPEPGVNIILELGSMDWWIVAPEPEGWDEYDHAQRANWILDRRVRQNVPPGPGELLLSPPATAWTDPGHREQVEEDNEVPKRIGRPPGRTDLRHL
jgi:hypothetical protein